MDGGLPDCANPRVRRPGDDQRASSVALIISGNLRSLHAGLWWCSHLSQVGEVPTLIPGPSCEMGAFSALVLCPLMMGAVIANVIEAAVLNLFPPPPIPWIMVTVPLSRRFPAVLAPTCCTRSSVVHARFGHVCWRRLMARPNAIEVVRETFAAAACSFVTWFL